MGSGWAGLKGLKHSPMTTTLDYANSMLLIYLNADDWQPDVIRHYLGLAISERVRIDREQEIVRMMEEDDDIF